MSPRAERALVRVNCAAFSDSLLESELFGHERGAFTGAVQAKPGLIELAEGGTFFLDEVSELPLSAQAKLLRVLEAREVQRVGSLRAKPIDVRFVAATNRDLPAAIRARTFREDLYHRLNGITVVIPPLRERVSEIRPLARAFVERACADLGRAPLSLSEEAESWLERQRWSGNIRELRNVTERAVLLCQKRRIGVEHLAIDSLGGPASEAAELHPNAPPSEPSWEAPSARAGQRDLRHDVQAYERERIVGALEACAGNQTRAARMLGISRGTMQSRLAAHGIKRPRV
jgi:transcriptional regulator with GAF, ATPase, and Fis domain